MGSAITLPEAPDALAPRAAHSLGRFISAAEHAGGVSLTELSPIDQLEVRTRNTLYRITLVDAREGRVLVQGGAFFPVQAEARLSGGSLGGSLLKIGWIGCGFCMELHHAGQRIVTTGVREIRRLGPGSRFGPH